ncbi:MAG: peptidase domain-containing ABC transporter [Ktedonobacteraceae bacterium]|nr:peptidase domain-containing ABC transporter [Ktedonobacteraceae bacterium]
MILQQNAVECGGACLAMILSYYGHAITGAEISAATDLGRDGLSARDLVSTARQYGLQTQALSASSADPRLFPFPAIIYWEHRHFLIVERWSRRFVEVIDPSQGRLRMTHQEFAAGFSHVVILLQPGSQFQRRRTAARKPATLLAYITRSLRLSPWLFLQILVASLLLQLFGLAVPFVTQYVVDRTFAWQDGTTPVLYSVGVLLFLLVQGLHSYFRSLRLIKLQTRVNGQVTTQFFAHLLKLPLPFFLQRSSGDLLARIASNDQLSDLVSNQTVSVLLDSLFVIVDLLILFHQSLLFGWIVLALALLQLCILLLAAPPLQRKIAKELQAFGTHQGYTAEVVNGIGTIKSLGAEESVLEKWLRLFHQHQRFTRELHTFMALLETVIQSLNLLAPFLLLGIGAEQVMRGQMSIGEVVALNALATVILAPLASLVHSGQQVQMARGHLARIQDVTAALPEQEVSQVSHPRQLTGDIRLERVSFHYPGQQQAVLQDIHLHIRPGQKVALVGQTGSGKSTLGKLLLGFYPPAQGDIFYDGTALRTLNLQAVRQQLGVVLQEEKIFHGSIKENITLRDPGLTMEQIERAARLAAFHEDVLRLPMGYETLVGEGGTALSGGQRQRLALARALAHQPAILLLDEATSALDVATERSVEDNLATLSCTQIIITHRLSTIQQADCIVVLDQGHIVEQGTHEQLLERRGYYASLLRQQLKQQDTEFVDVEEDEEDDYNVPTEPLRMRVPASRVR